MQRLTWLGGGALLLMQLYNGQAPSKSLATMSPKHDTGSQIDPYIENLQEGSKVSRST